MEAAARTVTDTTAAFTRAFLELQRATPAARARLLVLDSPPQHFDTPMGLFAAGRPQRRPCRAALAANASHAQALAHGPGNFRNIAKVRGVALALAELAGGNASTPAKRRVAFVRGWATAAQLDGPDAHWHHDSPDGGDGADRRNLAAGGADCTHDSPSALLYRCSRSSMGGGSACPVTHVTFVRLTRDGVLCPVRRGYFYVVNY